MLLKPCVSSIPFQTGNKSIAISTREFLLICITYSFFLIFAPFKTETNDFETKEGKTISLA